MDDEVIDSGTDFDVASGVESIGDSLFGGDSGKNDSGDADDGLEFVDSVGKEKAETAPAASTPAAVTPPADETAVAPKTWRPEAAAEWEKVPPLVRAEIAKREQDIFRGLESYKVDATIGQGFKNVLQPYAEVFQRFNIDPAQLTSNLMSMHYQMATGTPESKKALITKIAADYGVDLASETAFLDAPYVDPAVAALRKQNDELQSRLQRIEGTQNQTMQQQQNAAREKLNAEITTFASDPAHPYFDEIAADITAQIKAGAKDLAEAYERAVYANPVTRAKEIARISTEQMNKAQADAAERAKAARAATSGNVRAKARSGSAATSSRGIGAMEDTMKETLAAIHSRNN